MASIPTKQIILYKPRLTGTQKAWAAIYKEVKEVTKDYCTEDKMDCFTTKPEADAKASTNPDKPPKEPKP